MPPPTSVGPDEKGIKIYTEYKIDETGRKIKVTRKVKVLKKITRISPEMKARRKWTKFGHAEDDCEGVDPVTTQTSFEQIDMEDPDAELKEESTDNLLDKIALSGVSIGNKWRSGLGQGLKGLANSDNMPPPEGDDGDFPALGGGRGKYVPPSMRGSDGADRRRFGGTTMNDRDDSATLRVTNISEETSEDDLRELFGMYGRIKRCYLAKDRETGRGRGFAFISFQDRREAQHAMEKLQGHGYDHLILKIEFAQPRKDDGGGGGTQFRSGYGQKLAQDTTEKVATFSQHRRN